MPDGGFVTSFYDITELKRNEHALKSSEANIRLYTDSLPIMLSYLDNNRRVLFVNQAFEDIMGMKREKHSGQTCVGDFSNPKSTICASRT